MTALTRRAGRVLLLDRDGRVMLFRGGDPADPAAGTWWFTPGGGLDEGESPAEGAARELREETGLHREPGDLGQSVYSEQTRFRFGGRDILQSQDYFVIAVDEHDVSTAGFNALERASIVEHRWWSRDDLRTFDGRVYPIGLADLLDTLRV